MLLFFQ